MEENLLMCNSIQQRLQTMCAYVSKSRAGAKKYSTLVLGSVPPPSPAIIDSARLSAAHCIPHESRSLSRDIHSIASLSHNKPYPRKPRKFLPTVLIPFGTPELYSEVRLTASSLFQPTCPLFPPEAPIFSSTPPLHDNDDAASDD